VRRPGVALTELLDAGGVNLEEGPLLPDALHSAEVELKYEGYLIRERANAARLAELGEFSLPDDIEFSSLASLSREAREKLARLRPATLGQASRIPGVSPSDLQNVVTEVMRHRRGVSRETSE
jgi:tRNA uridine 5-carboxymethylaminomethyl modification enzyme